MSECEWITNTTFPYVVVHVWTAVNRARQRLGCELLALRNKRVNQHHSQPTGADIRIFYQIGTIHEKVE